MHMHIKQVTTVYVVLHKHSSVLHYSVYMHTALGFSLFFEAIAFCLLFLRIDPAPLQSQWRLYWYVIVGGDAPFESERDRCACMINSSERERRYDSVGRTLRAHAN